MATTSSMIDDATVVALYVHGTSVESLNPGDEAVVVLDHTPFYAESGGQVGDQGVLAPTVCASWYATRSSCRPTLSPPWGVWRHTLRIGSILKAEVDTVRRAATIRNHSATHLMHAALRAVLGAHVQQKGSLVDAEKTRFDFAHNAPMSDDEIRRVEAIVNAEVLKNVAAEVSTMAYDDAVKGGAMALFGEKYGDHVRVLDIVFRGSCAAALMCRARAISACSRLCSRAASQLASGAWKRSPARTRCAMCRTRGAPGCGSRGAEGAAVGTRPAHWPVAGAHESA